MFRNDEVISRRLARTWFGVTLLLGALMLALRVTAGSRRGTDPAAIVVGTWFLAFLIYRIARDWRPAPSRPDRLATASLVAPGLGLLALLPVTIHLPFFALTDHLHDFGHWVGLAVMLTAPTTVLAAILIWIRAIHLVEGRPATGALSPGGIYALGVAAVGPLWMLIVPGVLIMITGLPFISLLAHMETLVAREKAMADTGELPEARARFKEAA